MAFFSWLRFFIESKKLQTRNLQLELPPGGPILKYKNNSSTSVVFELTTVGENVTWRLPRPIYIYIFWLAEHNADYIVL